MTLGSIATVATHTDTDACYFRSYTELCEDIKNLDIKKDIKKGGRL